VYVANQAIPFMNPSRKPNITGFRMSADGRLTPIPGSTIEFPPVRARARSSSARAVGAGRDGRVPDRRTHPHLRGDGRTER
jgi:hypothetical protein